MSIFDDEADQVAGALDGKLFLDAAQRVGDGLVGDAKGRRDLGQALAIAEQPQNLGFTGAQLAGRCVGRGSAEKTALYHAHLHPLPYASALAFQKSKPAIMLGIRMSGDNGCALVASCRCGNYNRHSYNRNYLRRFGSWLTIQIHLRASGLS